MATYSKDQLLAWRKGIEILVGARILSVDRTYEVLWEDPLYIEAMRVANNWGLGKIVVAPCCRDNFRGILMDPAVRADLVTMNGSRRMALVCKGKKCSLQNGKIGYTPISKEEDAGHVIVYVLGL